MPIQSPFTQDPWTDLRPFVGTLAAFTHKFHKQRPRLRPSSEWDAAIALAIDIGRSYSSLAILERVGDGGQELSELYWNANEAEKKLHPFLDPFFRQQAMFWAFLKEASGLAARSGSELTERFAWWTIQVVRRSASAELELRSYIFEQLLEGIVAELDLSEVPPAARQQTERVSRFFSLAGRFPETETDQELFAAFEAALEAGEASFAIHLARHGWGQSDEDDSAS